MQIQKKRNFRIKELGKKAGVSPKRSKKVGFRQFPLVRNPTPFEKKFKKSIDIRPPSFYNCFRNETANLSEGRDAKLQGPREFVFGQPATKFQSLMTRNFLFCRHVVSTTSASGKYSKPLMTNELAFQYAKLVFLFSNFVYLLFLL